MDPVRRLMRGAIAVAFLANLTAAGCYTGAVTGTAFLKYLLPAVVLPSAGALIGTRKQLGGLIAAVGAAGIWAVLVNSLSGESSGPVARSSAICGLATALAVFGTRRTWTALVALGVTVNLAGALYYGASGEVEVLALVSALLTLIAASLIDAARHQRRVRRPRLAAVVLGLLATLALVVGTVAVQRVADRWMQSEPALVSGLVIAESVRPPWNPATSPPTTTATTVPVDQKPPSGATPEQKRLLRLIAFLVLLLIALMILVLVARLAIGAWRLQRWKRSLRMQPPAASTGAAFGWMTYQLQRFGWRLPDNPSVDRLPDTAHAAGWPEPLLEPVRAVCARSQRAIYEPAPCEARTASEAWGAAEHAVAAGRSHASRFRRLAAFAGLLRT